ncbi:hypothetical protein COTS27_01204 [Spirochaetota bacterium]|nr:hypothetical protein COTS27_01204 [Spirochaetota bacterium]
MRYSHYGKSYHPLKNKKNSPASQFYNLTSSRKKRWLLPGIIAISIGLAFSLSALGGLIKNLTPSPSQISTQPKSSSNTQAPSLAAANNYTAAEPQTTPKNNILSEKKDPINLTTPTRHLLDRLTSLFNKAPTQIPNKELTHSIADTKNYAATSSTTATSSQHNKENNDHLFIPPLVEYTKEAKLPFKQLISSQYIDYISTKAPSSNPPHYHYEQLIYDSEANKEITRDEIGDFIDEQGRDILLTKTNPYAAAEPKNSYTQRAKDFFRTSGHVIKKGESLWSISQKYQVSIDSLITLNNIENVHTLKPGQALNIPKYSGVYHNVKKGESLYSISQYYNVRTEDVVTLHANRDFLSPQQKVFVKNVRIHPSQRRKLFGNLFLLPLSGILTSSYGIRLHPIKNRMLFHTGIDLAAAYGHPVRSALAGRVISVSHQGGYGNRIVIKHALGYQTTYSHLSRFNVKKGQSIKRGQIIGRIGNSGLSTGPHLHFEIKHRNRFVNPIQFLPSLKQTGLKHNHRT